ncbi:MAG TPA: type II toxin-antitoxin system prevent-host-death family antitoxin [Terriglobales bacterium]|nr:type II toxin-antitoxin system prevent-host-death family antitoxin [Terriglobales bacterium]
MKPSVKSEQQVGVRELRQNLSVYLARVKRGECLEVTEHGRPVALLRPLPAFASWLETMIATGRATRAVGRLSDLGPAPPPEPGERPLSEVLEEMRNEERY